jgi:hypothetical protein
VNIFNSSAKKNPNGTFGMKRNSIFQMKKIQLRKVTETVSNREAEIWKENENEN